MKINKVPESELDPGFVEYLIKLNVKGKRKTQLSFLHNRKMMLSCSQTGSPPNYPLVARDENWMAELPDWMKDQRNQMTGPADNAEMVVKLLNSGSPGVMLDLEDSMANDWPELKHGIMNCVDAMHGELTYFKDEKEIGIKDSDTVIFVRVRGLHMSQHVPGLGDIPAPLFDLAAITYGLDKNKLKHPLCIYIPKTEDYFEAAWWKNVFKNLEEVNGWEAGWIKAMALVESHPMAYGMEEFARILQPYLVGLNLGRWDYMASLIDYCFNHDEFLFPDRNSIPMDIPFFQNLRHRMAYVCHKHGMLAIGGMSALFPDRKNEELNRIAQEKLKADKENEAACFMDGAWTGHPDQNEIAVAAFPYPNQLDKMPDKKYYKPNLREFPRDGLEITEQGTREAIRTIIKYRYGVYQGKGATLIDGYMEDLATDRIYRVMLAQRLYQTDMNVFQLRELFDDEFKKLGLKYLVASNESFEMVVGKEFNPV